MINRNAQKINQKIGLVLFDEADIHRLRLIKFTKKQIKDLYIEDLVDKDTKQGTEKLARLVKEILF